MQNKILELLEEKQFNRLHKLLCTLNETDIANYMADLKETEMLIMFRLLPKDVAADTFAEMDRDSQERLINALSDQELKEVLNLLFMDDTVDCIEEMPANIVRRILNNVTKSDRAMINELLKYPEDSAGSLMTPEYIALKESMTVGSAISYIRKNAFDKETIYICYVIDQKRYLTGLVTVKDLLISPDSMQISELMEKNVITVSTTDDQELVAQMFDRYNFLAMPVVDAEKRMVGIITIDDAVDVIQEENTEDFEKMAAIVPNDDSYFKTSIFKHAKNRIIWLMVLMLSATITGTIITKYEDAFSAIPMLVAFIPMLMDTGGNSGSQASTLIIRGMAMQEIRLKDYIRVVLKEARIALIVGVALAIVNGVRIVIQYHNVNMAIVISATIVLVVFIAKLLGATMPMLAKKCKLDPAIMAAPIITTLVDACSILIYFNIAVWVMNHWGI